MATADSDDFAGRLDGSHSSRESSLSGRGAPVRLVVLVTGLPGSGKSTVAGQLAVLLGLPLISKDAIKEALWDVLGEAEPAEHRGDAWRRLLGAAARAAMWRLLADAVGGAVVDDNLLADDGAQAARAVQHPGFDVHEVWCAVPIDQARRRFESRVRPHPVHRAVTDTDWLRWEPLARPLGIGQVHRVDTSTPVDVTALAEQISRTDRSVGAGLHRTR